MAASALLLWHRACVSSGPASRISSRPQIFSAGTFTRTGSTRTRGTSDRPGAARATQGTKPRLGHVSSWENPWARTPKRPAPGYPGCRGGTRATPRRPTLPGRRPRNPSRNDNRTHDGCGLTHHGRYFFLSLSDCKLTLGATSRFVRSSSSGDPILPIQHLRGPTPAPTPDTLLPRFVSPVIFHTGRLVRGTPGVLESGTVRLEPGSRIGGRTAHDTARGCRSTAP